MERTSALFRGILGGGADACSTDQIQPQQKPKLAAQEEQPSESDKMSIMITSDTDMVVTDTATSAADNLANVMLDPELAEDICQSAANAAAESVAKPVAKENVPDEKGVVFPTF